MACRKTHKQYWRLSTAADQIKADEALMDTARRISLLNQAGDNMGEVARLRQTEVQTIDRLNRHFARRRQNR